MEKITVVFLISIFVLSITNIPTVESLGMGATTSKEFVFEPNKEVDITVVVTNSLNVYFPIKIFTEGEIAQYMTFQGDKTEHILDPNGYAMFTFKLRMPEKFDNPGPHTAFIFAEQLPPKGSEGMIGLIRIGNKIYIHVPYPGKYIDAKISVSNKRINQNVVFEIETVNRGSINIENLYAEIDILDAEGNLVDTVTTNSMRAVPDNGITLKAQWYAGVKAGKYKARTRVHFDGELTTINEKSFNLGSPSIKIINADIEPILNSSVAKIPIQIMSEWNQRIDDVSLEMLIKDSTNSEVARLKSETVSIEPWTKKQLNIFWDTNGMGVGNYTGILTMYYLDKNETEQIELSIIPLSANVELSPTMFIAALIGIVILVGFIIFLKKRKNDNYSPYRVKSF